MMSELWRDLKTLRLLALKVGRTGPKAQVTLKGKGNSYLLRDCCGFIILRN